jgi:hypothetical protein
VIVSGNDLAFFVVPFPVAHSIGTKMKYNLLHGQLCMLASLFHPEVGDSISFRLFVPLITNYTASPTQADLVIII